MSNPYYQQQPSLPPQMPPAGGPKNKGNGNFWLGLLAGVMITAMIGCSAYVGVRLYLMAAGRTAKLDRKSVV